MAGPFLLSERGQCGRGMVVALSAGAVADPQDIASHINGGRSGSAILHHRDMGDIAIDGEHAGAAIAVLRDEEAVGGARMPSGPLIG